LRPYLDDYYDLLTLIYRLAYGQDYQLPTRLLVFSDESTPSKEKDEVVISELTQINQERLTLCKTPGTTALNELLTKFVETFLRHFQDSSFYKVLYY